MTVNQQHNNQSIPGIRSRTKCLCKMADIMSHVTDRDIQSCQVTIAFQEH